MSNNVKMCIVYLVLAVLFVGFIFFFVSIIPGEPDPNIECRSHGGVAKVNQNGNDINGIVCKDGHYADGTGD